MLHRDGEPFGKQWMEWRAYPALACTNCGEQPSGHVGEGECMFAPGCVFSTGVQGFTWHDYKSLCETKNELEFNRRLKWILAK